jgi:hypothetical protein
MGCRNPLGLSKGHPSSPTLHTNHTSVALVYVVVVVGAVARTLKAAASFAYDQSYLLCAAA